MNIKRLRDQLIEDEGVIYEIYNDHLGYPTFGIGHLIVEGEPEFGQPVGTPITEERVWDVFNDDVAVYRAECDILYGSDFGTWPCEVQEILVNMMFNMGRTRLSKFKNMNKHLHDQNWKEAAVEGRDSRWYKQVTNRAERLMTRLENIDE